MNSTAFLCNISNRWKSRKKSVFEAVHQFPGREKEVFEVDRTQPDSTEKILDQILRGSFNHIVSAGGDGTLNRLINGLIQRKSLGKFTFGLIPLGTCNDFAKTVGLNAGDVDGAFKTLKKENLRTVKIAKTGNHYFLNNAGFGRTNPGKKRTNAILDIARMKPKETLIFWDGKVTRDEFLMMVCANAPYFSGGLRFSANSDPADNLLEFFFVKKMSKLKLLGKFFLGKGGRPLMAGKLGSENPILEIRASKLSIQTQSPIWIMADGEAVAGLSAAREANFEIAAECKFIFNYENYRTSK